MLTHMTEDDWEIVLEVFQAVRSRRGGKGRDDRRFLEALHYFTVHNITWRALPAEFGPWNTVWRRFWPQSSPHSAWARNPLNSRAAETALANAAMSGASRCSGMLGISS